VTHFILINVILDRFLALESLPEFRLGNLYNKNFIFFVVFMDPRIREDDFFILRIGY